MILPGEPKLVGLAVSTVGAYRLPVESGSARVRTPGRGVVCGRSDYALSANERGVLGRHSDTLSDHFSHQLLA